MGTAYSLKEVYGNLFWAKFHNNYNIYVNCQLISIAKCVTVVTGRHRSKITKFQRYKAKTAANNRIYIKYRKDSQKRFT